MTCISQSVEALGQMPSHLPQEAADYITQYLIPRKLTPLYYKLDELYEREIALNSVVARSFQILRMSWEIPSLTHTGISQCIEQLDGFLRTAQAQTYYLSEEHVEGALVNTRSRLEAAPSEGRGNITVSAYADPETYVFHGWKSSIDYRFPVHSGAPWYPNIVAANTHLAPELGHSFDDYYQACLALIAVDMITPAWLPTQQTAVR